MKPLTLVAGLALPILVVAGAIQFVPYGRNHTNPPVQAEPNWDSPQTRALAVRACFDCHSNQTTWPWYSNLAPMSWMVQRDVDEGRRKLNFSEWGSGEQEADDSAEVVQRGRMPPAFYTVLHPEAALSAAERQALIAGLSATFGGESGEDTREGGASGQEDEDSGAGDDDSSEER